MNTRKSIKHWSRLPKNRNLSELYSICHYPKTAVSTVAVYCSAFPKRINECHWNGPLCISLSSPQVSIPNILSYKHGSSWLSAHKIFKSCSQVWRSHSFQVWKKKKSAFILREEVKLNLTLKCNHVHIGPLFAGGLCSYIKRSAFVSSARVEFLGPYGLLCCNQGCFWLRKVCCKCLELMSGLVDLHSTLKIFIKIHVKILAREESSNQHSEQSRVQNKIRY